MTARKSAAKPKDPVEKAPDTVVETVVPPETPVEEVQTDETEHTPSDDPGQGSETEQDEAEEPDDKTDDSDPETTGDKESEAAGEQKPPGPNVAPLLSKPLNAYGPGGEVIARSFDNGKNWLTTQAGLKIQNPQKLKQARGFTRRIAGMINSHTPTVDRRLTVPFGALHSADVLAGWAPYLDLIALEDKALQGIVIPFLSGMNAGNFAELRRVGQVLFLDVPSPMNLQPEVMDELFAAIRLVDVVLVPSELLAQKMRAYHEHVFVMPDLIDGNLWGSFVRAPKIPGKFGEYVKVTVSVPPANTTSPALEFAIKWAQDHFTEEKVEFVRFDWTQVHPADAPKVYAAFDVVVEDAPNVVSQVSDAAILPAFAAGCCVVCDRHFKLVRHMHNGLTVAKDTTPHWVEALRKAIGDSRTRNLLGRNGRIEARKYTPEKQLNKILLPFRLSIPAQEPVAYQQP